MVKSPRLIPHAAEGSVTRVVLVQLLQVIILLLSHALLTGAIQDGTFPVKSRLLGFKMYKI